MYSTFEISLEKLLEKFRIKCAEVQVISTSAKEVEMTKPLATTVHEFDRLTRIFLAPDDQAQRQHPTYYISPKMMTQIEEKVLTVSSITFVNIY